MASDNIQVAIRVRQLIQKELESGLKSHWTVIDNAICCDDTDPNGRKPTPYTFDRVFDDTTVTVDIFEEICKPIVDSAIAGFNGTIFVYGQSSSGKTFTMNGSRVQPGIISLAVDEIFNHIANIPDREFLIRVGYLEVYNEKVSDLLSNEDNYLKLQEDTDHNIQIAGLTEVMVTDGDAVNNVRKKGDAKRHTAETKQNDRSSRSHCILRFVIESREKGHEDDAVNVSNLYFVDLAGSEKANDNFGDRFREGCAINKSLFTLGMVIRKLSGDTSQQHVSFRDSKLTRILQNALGGNSKTAVICTITPAYVEESDSTLKFASRAKSIKNKAVVNEVMNDAAMMKRYRLKIKKLEEQIKEMNDTDINLEKAELEKRLQEKEAAEMQQAEMISKLQAMIVTSGSSHIGQEPPKKRRRETWCPGKAKRELHTISEISPPKFQDFKDKTLLVTSRLQDVVIEEEDSFQLLDNIMAPGFKPDTTLKEAYPDLEETIQTDANIKQLFELQDKHEIVLEELKKKDVELKELQEFTALEREMEAEQIKQLKEDLKKLMEDNTAMKENVIWLEEELMKAHKERNSLRQTVETTHAKLNAAEDGTGLTAKSKQLTASEAKVSDLNTNLETQKAQYEFHINQMKKKLEVYTLMLEEKGVDYNSIKARLSADVTELNEIDQLNKEKQGEIAQLKQQHEVEINDLRNEIDMLVLAVEKEKKQNNEAQERFELELEDQKAHFQKDIEEVKEEIEIYQQMLEEEKAKRMNSNQNNEIADSGSEADLSALKSEFESQKQTYEEEIARLSFELIETKKLHHVGQADSQDVSENNILTENTVFEEIFNKMKTDYESQVAKYETELLTLRNELEKEKLTGTDKEKAFQKQISDIEAVYGTRETELKGQLSLITVTKETDTKECQTEKTERHVNFDFGSELENQKDRYESLIKDLTEERNAYQSLFEGKTVCESLGNNADQLKVDNEQVSALLSVIKNYKQVCGINTMSVTDDNIYEESELETDSSDIHQLKKHFEDLTNEAKKQKEIKSSVKEGIRESQEFSCTFDESVCIGEGNETASDMTVSCGMDLQKEMLQAEINKLKEIHNIEVAELKQEISKYAQVMKSKTTSSSSLDISLNSLQEYVVKEENVDEVRAKFENEIMDLKLEIQKMTDNLNIEKIKNGATDDKVDLKSEVFKAEREEMEVKHRQEVQELQSRLVLFEEHSQQNSVERDDIETKDREIFELKEKLNTYEAMLQKERDKVEQILGAVDERRPEHEKHGSIMSMCEGKIRELNEDIKIYTDLLEEAKCQSSGDQIEREEFENLSVKYTEEIERLKMELEKFTNLYENEKDKIENSRKNTTEENILENEKLKEHIETLAEKHKKEIESMKEEFAKFVEANLKKKGEEEHNLEEIKKTYEKVIECLRNELQELKEKPKKSENEMTSDPFDLKTEMLKAELDELKEKYQSEVESLQSELTEMKMLHSDGPSIDDLRIKYEKEISELREKMKSNSVTSSQCSATVFTDASLDSQRELNRTEIEIIKGNFAEEIEQLKKSHREEIARLQTEIQAAGFTETKDADLNTDKDSIPDTDEVKQLRIDVENLQICLGKKVEKISEQEEELESARSQHEVYEGTIQEMQEVVGNMTSQLQQLHKDLRVLEAANDRLKQEKLDLINARERFSQKIDVYEETVKELQEEIKLTEEECELLRSRVAELETDSTVARETMSENDILKVKLESLESELNEKMEHAASCELEIESLKDKLAIAEKVNSEKIEKDSLNAEFKDKLKAAEENLKEVISEKGQLQNLVENLKQEKEEVEKKIDVYEETVKELQEKIKLNEEESEFLKPKVAELETDSIVAREAVSENGELKIKLESLESELNEKMEHVASCELEIETLKDKLAEAEEKINLEKDEIDILNAELKDKLKAAEENLKVVESEKEQLQNLVENLKQEKEEVEKKIDVYEEAVKELQEKIKLNEEESECLKSKVAELETDSKVARETVSENGELKIKLESLESELNEKMEHVASCELEIETLKDKLAEAEKVSLEKDEMDSLIAELNEKIKIAEERLEAVEFEKNQIQSMAEKLRQEKEEAEEKVKELEEITKSLEEDNLQLEKGLHPTSVKFHSLPENIDWETKWNEFAREEKKKRVAVIATVRGLKRELVEAQERQKNAYEEALEAVYEKERNTDVYKRLENDIKTVNEEANTLYYDLEEERKVTKELKEKIAKLEKDGHSTGKTQTDEMDSLKAELNEKIKIAEERLEAVEFERNQIQNMAEKLRQEKEEAEKKVKELEEITKSLEEDNLQLEKGLHPTSVKFHSMPENIDWETKWNEFVREEKKKRVAVIATVRGLKRELVEAQERQKNAYEEALEAVYEKERNTDVYKRLENDIKTVNEEANTLYYDLEAERKVTKELKEKIAKLEKDGHSTGKTHVDFMTEDHPCKYKLEAFSATEKMQSSEEELAKRVAQYEETITQYDARVARMKNEIRRLQTNMDTTFDVRSVKMPDINQRPQDEPSVPETPSTTPSSTENMSYGGSRSGLVDHFKVYITDAENKRLKKEIDKQKKKLSMVDDLEHENKKVKLELESLRKKFQCIEEVEKENILLKETLKKATSKNKDSLPDTSVINSSYSRNPFGEMFFTASETPFDSTTVPPSPKKEPRYKVPDLNPPKNKEKKSHEEEEANQCKTT